MVSTYMYIIPRIANELSTRLTQFLFYLITVKFAHMLLHFEDVLNDF